MSRADALVTADWAEHQLGQPGIVFVEVDEDTKAYDKGHIAGAVKLDWKTDLQDQVRRDFVDREQFSALLSERGIGNDDTVVLYGGNNNWFAAYWVGGRCTTSSVSSRESSSHFLRPPSSSLTSWCP